MIQRLLISLKMCCQRQATPLSRKLSFLNQPLELKNLHYSLFLIILTTFFQGTSIYEEAKFCCLEGSVPRLACGLNLWSAANFFHMFSISLFAFCKVSFDEAFLLWKGLKGDPDSFQISFYFIVFLFFQYFLTFMLFKYFCTIYFLVIKLNFI